MNRPAALLLALSAAAAGCNTELRPQYRVTDLRVLGVRAEVTGSTSADAAPGDTLQLSALVANPLGRTGLAVRWYGCAPAGPDDPSPCLEEEVLRDPSRLATTPGVALLGEGEAPAPFRIPLPEEEPFVAAAIAEVIRLAREQPTFRCRLYADIPVVVVAEAEGRREVAVKRVRLVPRTADLEPYPELAGAYELNLNPAIGEVVRAPASAAGCVAGTPLVPDPFPQGSTVLCTERDAPQQYRVCGAAGPQEPPVPETRSWQWFVTAGEFPDFDGIGNAVDDAPEFERPGGPFSLWVVMRDGRGGESWARRDVGPAPRL